MPALALAQALREARPAAQPRLGGAVAGGARQVHLGFPEARARLHRGATTEVYCFGNPIRPPPPPEPGDRAAALRAFGLEAGRPTLLVFGGSQGARAINYAVAAALERRGLGDGNVLWGTGAAHAAALASYAVPGRVVVQGFFDPMEIGRAHV